MKLRWAIATVGALALALLTLNVDLPWTGGRVDAFAPETTAVPPTRSQPT